MNASSSPAFVTSFFWLLNTVSFIHWQFIKFYINWTQEKNWKTKPKKHSMEKENVCWEKHIRAFWNKQTPDGYTVCIEKVTHGMILTCGPVLPCCPWGPPSPWGPCWLNGNTSVHNTVIITTLHWSCEPDILHRYEKQAHRKRPIPQNCENMYNNRHVYIAYPSFPLAFHGELWSRL